MSRPLTVKGVHPFKIFSYSPSARFPVGPVGRFYVFNRRMVTVAAPSMLTALVL